MLYEVITIGDGIEHGLGPHLPEAHMGAGHQRDGPGEAPAVAVEHGQRPQIDRLILAFGQMAERIEQQVQSIREADSLRRELVAGVSQIEICRENNPQDGKNKQRDKNKQPGLFHKNIKLNHLNS